MDQQEIADDQKLSCTFTLDVPGLGYLEGGTEADVSPPSQEMEQPSLEISQTKARGICDSEADGVDSSTSEIRITILASANPFTQVRQVLLNQFPGSVGNMTTARSLLKEADTISEFTTFPLPPAYSPRVRSALNASASSVRLSNLVGGNGWWYRWGRRIADV